jgi:hypothetical protein
VPDRRVGPAARFILGSRCAGSKRSPQLARTLTFRRRRKVTAPAVAGPFLGTPISRLAVSRSFSTTLPQLVCLRRCLCIRRGGSRACGTRPPLRHACFYLCKLWRTQDIETIARRRTSPASFCAAAPASAILAAGPARLPAAGLQSAPPFRRSALPVSNREFARLKPNVTPRKQTTAHRANRQKTHVAHSAMYPFLLFARHGRIAAL